MSNRVASRSSRESQPFPERNEGGHGCFGLEQLCEGAAENASRTAEEAVKAFAIPWMTIVVRWLRKSSDLKESWPSEVGLFRDLISSNEVVSSKGGITSADVDK